MAIIAAALLACSRADPPSLVSAESASIAPMPPPPPRPSAVASAAPSASAAPVDPGTLPQTKDKPEADSDAVRARGEALFEAILNDDPDRAMPAFFPKAAYEQVKAITNPASDWKWRLVANFKRDIHAIHFKLGRKSTALRFVSLDVGSGERWVEPGEEGNKLGYWRVYGSRIRYVVDGQQKSFDVSSLISWRGEWYVVHLTGFT
ncbi:MAG TPA: hypothetical protein VH054_25970 [Polyangiaceae bacterium]|nr:hypothetical protein [Polyangiaceae bacterium]